MKTRWFVQSDTTEIIPLGEHEDFEGADEACNALNLRLEGPNWIMSEESLRHLHDNINEALT